MVDPFLPDDEKVAAIRASLPATGAGIYLDTLRAGPFPAETARALAEADEWELRVGRAGGGRDEDITQREEEARAVLAALLLADPESIVLTHGAAEAAAQLAVALPLSAPDRWILVSGGDATVGSALRAVAVARGLAAVASEASDIPRLAGSALGLLVLPHVDERTGAELPVAEMARAARRTGALVVLDASASAGAIPIDPQRLEVDAVILPAHRWLLGPEGAGALWLGPGALSLVDPWALRSRIDPLPRRSSLGLARSLGWLEMYVGLPWAYERTAALTGHLVEALRGVKGLAVLTPPEAESGTVSVRVEGWTAEEAIEELGRRTFAILGSVEVDRVPALRMSLGCWNTHEELDRLAGALVELASHTPETLPRRPSLMVVHGDGTTQGAS